MERPSQPPSLESRTERGFPHSHSDGCGFVKTDEMQKSAKTMISYRFSRRTPFFCLALSRAVINPRARFVELCRRRRTHRPRDGKLEARGRHSEQILKILNRNTGLMVELKRWIAQDAGESGQVLEESLTPQVARGSGCGSPANRPVHL